MTDLEEIKTQLAKLDKKIEDKSEALEAKMVENTALTAEGFKTMNGRVKRLELREAKREGAESVTKPVNINWTKILLSAFGVAMAALALATILAQAIVGKQ